MKVKICAFEEVLTKDVLMNFLDNSKFEIHVVSPKPPDGNVIKETYAFFRMYKNVIRYYTFNNHLPSRMDFHVVIFPSVQYERGKLTAENFDHLNVFVEMKDGLNPETVNNFQVTTWQFIHEWLLQKYRIINGKPEKSKVSDSDSNSQESEREQGT